MHKRGINAGKRKGSAAWNKGVKIGPHKQWKEKFPAEEIFVEDSKYARTCVKRRILQDNLIEYKCNCCGIGSTWHGKPLTLILDHINGKNNDNRLENLRFVCSNCDSQLDTYKSKNRRKCGRVDYGNCLESSRG